MERDPPSPRGRVLVLDGGIGQGSLAVLRSLGAAGYETHLGFAVGVPRRVARSRYCAGTVAYPDPTYARAEFQHALLEVADRFDFLLPVKEATLLATAEVKDAIRARGAVVPIADASAFLTATNKVETLRLADELGLHTPQTIVRRELPPASEIAATVGLPFVMKTATEFDLGPADRHFLVTEPDGEATRERFEALARHGPVLLQRYVAGFGSGIGLLYSGRSEVVAFTGHRRIFEQFSDGGPSVLARTFVHPEALDQARRLLDALRWKGIAMVEFRIRPDGTAVLMEVNPRVWGTMSLAIASGVDFPTRLLESFGAPGPSVPEGPVRDRNFLSLDALLVSQTSPPVKRPRLGAFALDLGRSMRGLSIKELQGRDPRPEVEEAFHRLRSLGTRRRISEVGGVRFGPFVDYRRLAARHVRTTIDLRSPEEVARRAAAAAPGVERVAFPIPDDTGLPPDRFRDLVGLIDRGLAGGGLFVHCRQGKGRAPMAVVAHLVAHDVPIDRAFETVYAARPSANLNAEQRGAIYRFDRARHA